MTTPAPGGSGRSGGPPAAGRSGGRPARGSGARATRRDGRGRSGEGSRTGGRSTPAAAADPGSVDPPLPPDVTASDLDRLVLRDLRSLPAGLADRVARHLVAAGRLLDEDPAAAHAHARAARRLAGRIAAVREAAGITAYRAGRYGEALTELRAARRMTGSPEHLPVLADSERGLGRPERALALTADPDADRLSPAARVELRIVAAGARRDLGQTEAALVTLQESDLDAVEVAEWTPRLWYAYADTLAAAGRLDAARHWFAAAAAVDEDGETDAAERLAELDSARSAGSGPGTGPVTARVAPAPDPPGSPAAPQPPSPGRPATG